MQDAQPFSPDSPDISNPTTQSILAESEAILERLVRLTQTAPLSPELQEHLGIAWLRKIDALYSLERYPEVVGEVDALQRHVDGDDASSPVSAWPWLAQAACRKVTALARQGELSEALGAARAVQTRFQQAKALQVREWLAFAGLEEIRIRVAMGATFARVDMVRNAQHLIEQYQRDDWPATRVRVGHLRLEQANLLAELDYDDDALRHYAEIHADLAGASDDALRELAADALLARARRLKALDRTSEAWQTLQTVLDECAVSTHAGLRHTLVLAQFDRVRWADGEVQTIEACNALLAEHIDSRPAQPVIRLINKALRVKAQALITLAGQADDATGESLLADADAVTEEQLARYAHYPDESVQEEVLNAMLARLNEWSEPQRVLDGCNRLLMSFQDTAFVSLSPRLMRALLLKSWALRQLDQAEAALTTLDQLETRYPSNDSPMIRRQRVFAVIERSRVLRQLQQPEKALAALTQVDAFLDAVDAQTDDELTLRDAVATALNERVEILAAATPGRHPRQEEGRDDAGELIRAPITVSEQAYAEAVATLAGRFHSDSHCPTRNTVAGALYNLAVHQRVRLHLDEALSNYGLVLQYYAADAGARMEQYVADAYLNRAYLLMMLLGRNADALADYDALLKRFANASNPAMRDTLAKTAASRLTCLNRMQRAGVAVNYGDQYEELTLEQRDAMIATVRRADSLSNEGKHGDAIAIYDQVLAQHIESLHPELRRQCLDVMVRKAFSLAELGQWEAALAVNNEVIARYESELSTTAEEDVALAMANKAANLSALGRHDEELSVYDQIIERWQDSRVDYLRRRVAKALFGKAVTVEEHDKEQALSLYRCTMNNYLHADDLLIRLEAAKSAVNAGLLLRKMGRYADALTFCEALLQACGEDTDAGMGALRVKAQICAARSYGAAGMPARAVDMYTRLLTLPEDAVDTSLRRRLLDELHVIQPPQSMIGTLSRTFKGLLRSKQAR